MVPTVEMGGAGTCTGVLRERAGPSDILLDPPTGVAGGTWRPNVALLEALGALSPDVVADGVGKSERRP